MSDIRFRGKDFGQGLVAGSSAADQLASNFVKQVMGTQYVLTWRRDVHS